MDVGQCATYLNGFLIKLNYIYGTRNDKRLAVTVKTHYPVLIKKITLHKNNLARCIVIFFEIVRSFHCEIELFKRHVCLFPDCLPPKYITFMNIKHLNMSFDKSSTCTPMKNYVFLLSYKR